MSKVLMLIWRISARKRIKRKKEPKKRERVYLILYIYIIQLKLKYDLLKKKGDINISPKRKQKESA